jgi:hypothetical protein
MSGIVLAVGALGVVGITTAIINSATSAHAYACVTFFETGKTHCSDAHNHSAPGRDHSNLVRVSTHKGNG